MTRLPNRRYSNDYKAQLLNEFKSSEKSYKEFAKDKDIPWRTLYDWINRPCTSKRLNKGSKASFAPISVKAPIESIPEEITITYPNGVEIKLPLTTDVKIISSLVKQF